MISLSIDGKKVTVNEGTSVLEAARGVGAQIPTLCYHPELTVNSACRLCTVEVIQGKKTWLTASCALPAAEGMEVKTASERVLSGRRIIMELLLARSPDAPRLKEIAADLGAKTDRLEPKHEDCILCGLCVGVCAQKLGVRAIAFSGRGIARKVTRPFDKEASECLACGACAYLCPTGAMQMEHKTLERDRAQGTPHYCRYMRMGVIPYAICPASYDCAHCEVDQRMEDTLGDHPAFYARLAKQTEPIGVRGYSVMPDRYYHSGHAWVERVGGYLRLGVDDFAQKLAGPADDLELLKERGAEVKAGESLWRLKLDNHRSVTMLSPVSGTLLSINEDVLLDPTLLRKAPYDRGWICLIRPSAVEEDLAALRFKEASVPLFRASEPDPVSEWVNGEVEKLRQMLADQGAEVPAEGAVGVNLAAVIPDAGWQTMTQTFFGTQQ